MNNSEIKDVIQLYFNANFDANEKKIAEIFHDLAHIYGFGKNGAFAHMDKAAFVKKIESNEPNAPDARFGEILSIDFLGEFAAVARVKIRVGDMLYTDSLNFLYLEGKWTIIAKVFSGVPV